MERTVLTGDPVAVRTSRALSGRPDAQSRECNSWRNHAATKSKWEKSDFCNFK